jgi:hypothetical protein
VKPEGLREFGRPGADGDNIKMHLKGIELKGEN